MWANPTLKRDYAKARSLLAPRYVLGSTQPVSKYNGGQVFLFAFFLIFTMRSTVLSISRACNYRV